jgi:hypothetical protein
MPVFGAPRRTSNLLVLQWHEGDGGPGHRQVLPLLDLQWSRTHPVRRVPGTREVDCRDCSAHGLVHCAPCGGTGLFTQAHSLTITAHSSATLSRSELPEACHDSVSRWFKNGPQWTDNGALAEVVPRWAYEELRHGDVVRDSNGSRAVMRFTCETAHGVARGNYEGKPFVASCLYLEKPKFAFNEFLDGTMCDVIERSRKYRMERPSTYLSMLSSSQPGIASLLRQSFGGGNGHHDFCNGVSLDTFGAVSSSAVRRIAEDYKASLDSYQRCAFWTGAGLSIAILAGVWALAWVSGLFELFMMFNWRTRPYAFLVFAGVMAIASKRLLTAMGRYAMQRETRARSRTEFGWKGWLLAVPLGILLSLLAHWGMVFDASSLW